MISLKYSHTHIEKVLKMEKYSIKIKNFIKKYGVINLASEKTLKNRKFREDIHMFI